MKFETTTTYNGPRERAQEVLMSEELAKKRANVLGVDDVEFFATGSTSTMKVAVPAQKLPEAARRFLSNGSKVTIVASANDSGESTVIDHDIQIHGAPAKATLRIVLTDASENTTTAVASGDIKVSVPFVGGKIESAAVKQVQSLVDKDAKLVNELM